MYSLIVINTLFWSRRSTVDGYILNLYIYSICSLQ